MKRSYLPPLAAAEKFDVQDVLNAGVSGVSAPQSDGYDVFQSDFFDDYGKFSG